MLKNNTNDLYVSTYLSYFCLYLLVLYLGLCFMVIQSNRNNNIGHSSHEIKSDALFKIVEAFG